MTSSPEPQKIDLEKLPNEKLVRDLEGGKEVPSKKMLLPVVGIILAGIFSGFLLHNVLSKGSVSTSTGTSENVVSKGESAGSSDTKTFKDSAEGQLEAEGLNGEGTHRLTRPGGDSQTVYLTSSVLDLNKYIGKKVRVWGQTFSAKKAGWLMDVGKVEVL